MKNTDEVYGILKVYPNENSPEKITICKLVQGDNFLTFTNNKNNIISKNNCSEDALVNIILNEEDDYNIEDLGKDIGVLKGDTKKRLKSGKLFDLQESKPYFLENTKLEFFSCFSKIFNEWKINEETKLFQLELEKQKQEELRVLEENKIREAEEKRKKEAEERKIREEEEEKRKKAELEEAKRIKAEKIRIREEEEKRKKIEEEKKIKEEEEKRKKIEEIRKLKEEEEKRKKFEEEKRLEEEEEKRLRKEEMRKLRQEEEKRKKLEEAKKIEEERKKIEDEKKIKEEERKKIEDIKTLKEAEEKRKKIEDKKKIREEEEKIKKIEEKKKFNEAEEKRKRFEEEEKKRIQKLEEEKQIKKAEEEKKILEEEEKKKMAEEKRRLVDEKKKHDEERRLKEIENKQRLEEVKKIEDELKRIQDVEKKKIKDFEEKQQKIDEKKKIENEERNKKETENKRFNELNNAKEKKKTTELYIKETISKKVEEEQKNETKGKKLTAIKFVGEELFSNDSKKKSLEQQKFTEEMPLIIEEGEKSPMNNSRFDFLNSQFKTYEKIFKKKKPLEPFIQTKTIKDQIENTKKNQDNNENIKNIYNGIVQNNDISMQKNNLQNNHHENNANSTLISNFESNSNLNPISSFNFLQSKVKNELEEKEKTNFKLLKPKEIFLLNDSDHQKNKTQTEKSNFNFLKVKELNDSVEFKNNNNQIQNSNFDFFKLTELPVNRICEDTKNRTPIEIHSKKKKIFDNFLLKNDKYQLEKSLILKNKEENSRSSYKNHHNTPIENIQIKNDIIHEKNISFEFDTDLKKNNNMKEDFKLNNTSIIDIPNSNNGRSECIKKKRRSIFLDEENEGIELEIFLDEKPKKSLKQMFENTLKTIINESKEPKINSTKNKEEDQNPSKNKAEGLKSSENIFQEDTPKKKKNILISNSQLIENISKVPNNQIVENKSPKKRKRKDILLDNEKKSVDKSPYKLIKSNNLKKQNKIDYIEKRTENKDKKSIKLQKKRVKSKLCAEKEEELNYKKIRQNIRKQYKVLYSGCIISEDEKKILKTLGLIFIENKQKNFNVLIMPKYKRTIKFLLALTKGIAIVNNLWLKDSIKKKTLLDYNQYLIKDENSEKIYKYNLQSSLEKRKNCYEGFLKEYKIWVPLTIKPNYQDIKLLIKESDGEILSEMYKGKSKNCINIMNDNDEEVQEKIKEGYIVYSLEMLYTGIMRQKLEFSNFLFK